MPIKDLAKTNVGKKALKEKGKKYLVVNLKRQLKAQKDIIITKENEIAGL